MGQPKLCPKSMLLPQHKWHAACYNVALLHATMLLPQHRWHAGCYNVALLHATIPLPHKWHATDIKGIYKYNMIRTLGNTSPYSHLLSDWGRYNTNTTFKNESDEYEIERCVIFDCNVRHQWKRSKQREQRQLVTRSGSRTNLSHLVQKDYLLVNL